MKKGTTKENKAIDTKAASELVIDMAALDIQEIEIEETTVIENPDENASETTEKPSRNKVDPFNNPKVNYDMDKIPDVVTPSMLDAWFMFLDGGKSIRRHLRKYFANVSKHEHKSSWSWAKGSNELQDIMDYFTSRYGAPHYDKYTPKTK